MNRKPDIKKRIINALSNGRMIYDTGRKMGNAKVYESLNEETRKLFGLEPLEKIIPNFKELLPTQAELIWKKMKHIESVKNRRNNGKRR